VAMFEIQDKILMSWFSLEGGVDRKEKMSVVNEYRSTMGWKYFTGLNPGNWWWRSRSWALSYEQQGLVSERTRGWIEWGKINGPSSPNWLMCSIIIAPWLSGSRTGTGSSCYKLLHADFLLWSVWLRIQHLLNWKKMN
jgi:hypothetical protein